MYWLMMSLIEMIRVKVGGLFLAMTQAGWLYPFNAYPRGGTFKCKRLLSDTLEGIINTMTW